MAGIQKFLLSGSTNGKPIPIAATSSTGTTIHTAGSGTSLLDMIYAWVSNLSAAAVNLTVEFGGTGDSGLTSKTISIPAFSPPILIVPGLPLQNALLLTMFAGTTNVLNITGYVDRIT